MRLTSKGQVTIPKPIRDELGLLPGTEVEFEVDGNAVRMRKAQGQRGRGWEIVEHLKKAGGGDLKMSTDEIMALTRGD